MARKKAPRAKSIDNSSHSSGERLSEKFGVLAQAISRTSGRPGTFMLAIGLVIVWGLSGPLFDYSNTWQLMINTTTTIVTFLMVFLIQNTQNRDALAVQLKLTEVILAMKDAPDKFAVIEDLTDAELEAMHDEFRKQADATLGHIKGRKTKGNSKA